MRAMAVSAMSCWFASRVWRITFAKVRWPVAAMISCRVHLASAKRRAAVPAGSVNPNVLPPLGGATALSCVRRCGIACRRGKDDDRREGVAAEIVREVAAAADGGDEVGVDVGGWGGQDVRTLFDALLAGLAASPCRLKGVQADRRASQGSACPGTPRARPATRACPSL